MLQECNILVKSVAAKQQIFSCGMGPCWILLHCAVYAVNTGTCSIVFCLDTFLKRQLDRTKYCQAMPAACEVHNRDTARACITTARPIALYILWSAAGTESM